MSQMPGRIDRDLFIGKHCAYQMDQRDLVEYGEAYFDKCAGYEGAKIANTINACRAQMVDHYRRGPCLDIGIGSGEFIRTRPRTWGYDVNPVAVKWLKEVGMYSEDIENYYAITFWDVIEHVPDPSIYLDRISEGSVVFFSVPILDMNKIRDSKHYRPGEHLYYWDEIGFPWWLEQYGFQMLERRTFEITAGRESIYSYVFRK